MDLRHREASVPTVTVDSLSELVAGAFEGDGELGVRVQGALEYLFAPELVEVELGGVTFRLVLNESRYRYVSCSLSQDANFGAAVDVSRYLAEYSKHRPPPGARVCPFDNLEENDLLLGILHWARSRYGILVNKQPWGYHHFMLVACEERGQTITQADLCACFAVLRALGKEYEATFSGVLAGASVLHFHFQIHRGAAAIWKNIDSGRLSPRAYRETRGASLLLVEGWPAEVFVVEGQNDADVAACVCRLVEVLGSHRQPIPYNLGVRHTDRISVCVVPRATPKEKPIRLNDHSDSWGRFSFNEMGGSIVLLTRAGLESTRDSPGRILDAIAEMSITRRERDELLRAL